MQPRAQCGILRGVPRRIKFDPDQVARICAKIADGHSVSASAMSEGLNPQTLWNWATRGRSDPETYPQYADIADDLEIAHAQRTVERERLTMDAARAGDWKAAMHLEAKQNPRQYGEAGKPLPEAPEAPPGLLMGAAAPTAIELDVLTQEDRDSLRRAIKRRAGGSDGGGPGPSGRSGEPPSLRASNNAPVPGELAPRSDRS